jgi:leader peptidase (prepilin peptidase) / N-methyltransferase
MYLFFSIVAALFGLVLGSFFNVLIYRLPRRESIVRPGSHCPNCGRPVRPWENIPVASYVVLRGKCAGCGWNIPLRYPLVEAFTGAAALVWYAGTIAPSLEAGLSPVIAVTLALQTAVLLAMIPVAVIDFTHLVIPESITLPLLALAVIVSFLPRGLTPLQCGLGVLVGAGFLYSAGILGKIAFRKKETMGFGDVELLAMVGAAFGPKIAFLTILFGTFAGLGGAIFMAMLGKLGKNHVMPFGPFLGMGLWIAVLAGNRVVDFYFAIVDNLVR